MLIDCDDARGVAERFGLPATETPPVGGGFVLALIDGRLELRDGSTRPGRGLSVRFDGERWKRGSAGLSRRQPLARAIGRDAVKVLDATAGLGGDTALLAALGYRVTAVERCAALAALLADGARRAADEHWPHPVPEIIHGDARALLERRQFDAVYIDPMFPPRRKATALPKKSMQWVRRIVGEDSDAVDLIESALASGAGRVILKRPVESTASVAGEPQLTFTGKLARYDVFFAATRNGA